MKVKTKNRLKKNTTNLFGAFGYFFVSLQWLWVILLYSSLIIVLAESMGNKPNKELVSSAPAIDISSSVPMLIISGTIVAIMSVLTIYILIKIPTTLVKASKKVVQNTAKNATPLLLQAQNKKDTKRNRIKLTPVLIIVMKIVLVLIPILLVFASQYLENQTIDFYISIYIGVLLACFSLLLFVFQYLAAAFMLVKKQEIW